MIGALVRRELRLSLRRGSSIVLPLAFMALFVLLCGLALGGSRPELGPGLLWLAATLSILLGLERLYQPDQSSGALAQLHLAGVGSGSIAAAKAIAFALTTLLPLLLAAPLLALLLGMSGTQIAGTVLSLVVGGPALIAYASVSAALLCAQRGGAVLSVLLSAPLLIPVLIFGVEAAESYPALGLGAVQFRILAGLSLLALALGGPATVAAISANRGPA